MTLHRRYDLSLKKARLMSMCVRTSGVEFYLGRNYALSGFRLYMPAHIEAIDRQDWERTCSLDGPRLRPFAQDAFGEEPKEASQATLQVNSSTLGYKPCARFSHSGAPKRSQLCLQAWSLRRVRRRLSM